MMESLAWASVINSYSLEHIVCDRENIMTTF
jgi:hypothetical protein